MFVCVCLFVRLFLCLFVRLFVCVLCVFVLVCLFVCSLSVVVWSGLVWSGLWPLVCARWAGLVWSGLAGLVWSVPAGLVWSGLGYAPGSEPQRNQHETEVDTRQTHGRHTNVSTICLPFVYLGFVSAPLRCSGTGTTPR